MEQFAQLLEMFAGNIFLYVFTLLFALLLVIFVHEMGHYLAARYFGVRIDKFSLGLGKEVFGRTDKHGTRWCISRWPLGGFIKIFGDTHPDNPKIWDRALNAHRPLTEAEKHVAFYNKPVWQRVIIVAAGPVANLFLTFLILFTLFVNSGQPALPPVVTAVALGTAADEAGFEPGDVILTMDEQPVKRFQEIWRRSMYELNHEFVFEVRRGNQEMTMHVQPRPVEYKDTNGIARSHGRLGATHIVAVKLEDIIAVNGVSTEDDPEKARALLLEQLDKNITMTLDYDDKENEVFRTIGYAQFNAALSDPASKDHGKFFTRMSKERLYIKYNLLANFKDSLWQMQKLIVEAFNMTVVLFSGGGGDDKLGGMASLSDSAGKAAQDGVYTFMLFLAVFSIQIAYINLLPIPMLDGGYLVFFIWEALRGKPLSRRFQDYAVSVGLVLLVGIMIIANLSDIFQFTR